MAKFCSWCGEPLSPGEHYCPECGGRVLESVRVSGKGSEDPMRGLDIVRGHNIKASATAKLDREVADAMELKDDFDVDGVEVDVDAKAALDKAAAAHVEDSAQAASSASSLDKLPHPLTAASAELETAVSSEPAAQPEAPVEPKLAKPEESASATPSASADIAKPAAEQAAQTSTGAAAASQHESVPVVPRSEQSSTSKPIAYDGTDTLVLPTGNEAKRFGLERPDLDEAKRKRIVTGLIIAVIVLAVACAVVGAWSMGLFNPSESQPVQQEEQAPAQEEQAPAQEEIIEEEVVDATKPTEEQIFQTLSSAYDALPAYSDRIVECVDEFNGLFMAKQLDTRTACKDKADALLAELQKAKEELVNLEVSSESAYASDAANVIELYDCQIGRIQCICDAWALDVTFTEETELPYLHKDEILAELSKDYVAGNNPYLERFDELYPTSKPTEK